MDTIPGLSLQRMAQICERARAIIRDDADRYRLVNTATALLLLAQQLEQTVAEVPRGARCSEVAAALALALEQLRPLVQRPGITPMQMAERLDPAQSALTHAIHILMQQGDHD